MTEQFRWFFREAFGPTALSARTLLLVFPFGVVVAGLTMPFGVSSTSMQAWGIAVAAQALFTAVALIGRWVLRSQQAQGGDGVRVLIVVVAGALRGLIIVALAAMAAGAEATISQVATRSINSVLFSVLALAFMGLLVNGSITYRAQYRELLERALRLQQEARAQVPHLDSSLIAQWVGVQQALQATASRTQAVLTRGDVSPEDLHAAARVIAGALEHEVRPMSHGLWQSGSRGAPRLRPSALLWDALRPWRPPVLIITLVFLLISMVGAITRAGIAEGSVFSLYVTVTVLIVIALSARVGSALPASRLVGITTLLVLPVVVIAVAQLVGQVLLDAREDLAGAVVSGVSASLITLGFVVLRRVSVEREILLLELQYRIDTEALGVLADRAESSHWERSLGEFVHHSVQSELTAIRLQLVEASKGTDLQVREQTRQSTLARFDRLLALDPPWLAGGSGRDVIDDVVRAWEGIAVIDAHLTEAGDENQWRIAGRVVEEGVANAIRAGGARAIAIDVQQVGEALVVTIVDDGSGMAEGHESGLGTLWLDQVVPGAWQRSSGAEGTRLVVRIDAAGAR